MMELIVFNQAVAFHKVLSYALLGLVCLNFLSLFHKNFLITHKIMWYSTPLIFGILAIMLLSGVSILAMRKFEILSPSIGFMIIINILIIIAEIRRIKILRKVRKSPSQRNGYIKMSRIYYGLYFCFIFGLYW